MSTSRNLAAGLALIVCALLLVASSTIAQTVVFPPDIRTAPIIRGADTLKTHKFDQATHRIVDITSNKTLLAFNDAASTPAPELLGVVRAGDTVVAVFDGIERLNVIHAGPGSSYAHHVDVWRGLSGGSATRAQSATLTGGLGSKVRFFVAPAKSVRTSLVAPQIFISIMQTTDHDDVYQLRAGTKPNASPTAKLFRAYDYQFADFAHDGTYQIIAWRRQTYDLRCNFAIESEHTYPEVYASTNGKYTKVWPLAEFYSPDADAHRLEPNRAPSPGPTGQPVQIQATFADLFGNGAYEVVSLDDTISETPQQSLATYKFKDGAFEVVSRVSISPPKIAFLLSGVRTEKGKPQIVLRQATPEKCKDGGDFDDAGTSELLFRFSDGQLWHDGPYIGVK